MYIIYTGITSIASQYITIKRSQQNNTHQDNSKTMIRQQGDRQPQSSLIPIPTTSQLQSHHILNPTFSSDIILDIKVNRTHEAIVSVPIHSSALFHSFVSVLCFRVAQITSLTARR